VEKGLLRELHLAPDLVLFDPNTDRHHHFIDEGAGRIYDIPWNQIEVSSAKPLPGFEVDEYQVVMGGRRRHARRRILFVLKKLDNGQITRSGSLAVR